MQLPAIAGGGDGQSRAIEPCCGLKWQRCSPPQQLHQFGQYIGQTKGHQQFRHMTTRLHRPQHPVLKPRPQQAHQRRRQPQRHGKAQTLREAIAHIGTQHVQRRVCKVEHAHQAKNERQPRTEHKQQQPIAQAIEHGQPNIHPHTCVRPSGGTKCESSGFSCANRAVGSLPADP